MRLRALRFTSFRSYVSASIADLPDFSYFGGMNGAGKSTILDAIAAGLTGTCRGADSGRGLDELRSSGETRGKWEIRIGVQLRPEDESLQTFARTEKDGPRSAIQTRIDQALGIPPARVRACLYSGELLRLDAKEGRRLILDLCGEGIAVPEEVSASMRRIFGFAPPPRTTLSEIEGCYKGVYERRRETGARLRAAQVAAPVPPEGMEGLASSGIGDVRLQRSGIEGKIGELRTEQARVNEQLRALETKARDLGSRLGEARSAVSAATSSNHRPMNVEAEKKKLAALEEKADKLDHDAREADRMHEREVEALAAVDVELEAAREALASSKGLGFACPTCQRAFPKEDREEQLEKLTTAVMKLEEKRGRVAKRAEDARAKLTGLPGSIKIRQEIRDLRATITRYEANIETAQVQGETVAALEKELAAAAAEEQGQTAGLRDELSKLVDRILTGEKRLGAILRYEGARSEYERAGTTKAALETEHAELEQLVEALGPNGFRTSATGGVEELQGEINGMLSPLGLSVDLLPFVRGSDDLLVNGRPARLLSSSEAIRFGVAFQCAVASWSGVGVVCVDDFDRFDQVSAAGVQGMLASSGHQVLVFSTIRGTEEAFLEKAAAACAGGSGVQFYLVTNGEGGSRVERVGAEVTADA